MLALVFDGALRLRRDFPAPRPQPHEALIRVRTAGICSTDLEITRGYKGFRGVLGHEFVGDVVECASAEWVGRRVCGEINIACGSCSSCTSGLPTHCLTRRVVGILGHDGAFAEYLTLPIVNLHTVPDGLPDDGAVFVEPVAAAYEILRQVPTVAGAAVTVLGDGKLGLLCAQVLRGAGARVWVLGRHAEKVQLARELGLGASLDSDIPRPADIVVEATGSPSGLQRAIDLIKPRGTIVLKTTSAARSDVDWSALVVNEITVVGSRCGPFADAIHGLQSGDVQVEHLIAARYSLEDGVTAMSFASRSTTMKVLLDAGPR